MNKGRFYNYSDIGLLPEFSEVYSRQDCNTEVNFANRIWKLPVVPANMKCVIDFQKAEELVDNGYFYILHRFHPYQEIIDWCKDYRKRKENSYISLSVGVTTKDYLLIDELILEDVNPDCITVDVAHGYSKGLREIVKYIKQNLPNTFVIGGNVSTTESIYALEYYGCDAIKVGIANGKACTTFNKTGVGTPMFTTVQMCSQIATVPIIADGGIKENGDVAKALVAGADMVMIGSKFAELKDSPADTMFLTNKIYYGSASEFNKDEKKNIEGTKVILPIVDMTYLEKYQEMTEDLQSTISYLGGNSLEVFKKDINYGILS